MHREPIPPFHHLNEHSTSHHIEKEEEKAEEKFFHVICVWRKFFGCGFFSLDIGIEKR